MYIMLKNYNCQNYTGKLNPDPNGSEENQMECSIQKQPSENPDQSESVQSPVAVMCKVLHIRMRSRRQHANL